MMTAKIEVTGKTTDELVIALERGIRMGLQRFWSWRCDVCGKIEVRNDYGLPRGWVFRKARVLTHHCEACQTGIPEKEKGKPQVVAER